MFPMMAPKHRAAMVLTLIALVTLAPIPAAQAGGAKTATLITTADLAASEASEEPVVVSPGSWLRLRPRWIAGDEFIDQNFATLTVEVFLDGKPVATDPVIEDIGVLCDSTFGDEICLDASSAYYYALVHPLPPKKLHTVTFRFTFSEPGADGFGFTWDAGVFTEVTGTLLVRK